MQQPQQNKQPNRISLLLKAVFLWLKEDWVHVVLLSASIGLIVWMALILRSSVMTSTEKAAWLIIPTTGVYVVINVYIAIGSIKAANSSREAVSVMRSTINEMRFATNALYMPQISFPLEQKCWIKANDTAVVALSNLTDQPAYGFQMFAWEMEVGRDGTKSCKLSSLREAGPVDLPGNVINKDFTLHPSSRTDAEKLTIAVAAMDRFRAVYGKIPEDMLIACTFYTKTSERSYEYVYEFAKVTDPRPAISPAVPGP